MKLNIGAGSNNLTGWLNTDLNRSGAEHVDMTQPLPFASESVDFVFAEHTVEHISPAQAWGFFKEVRRVLKPGGIFRIAVPSIERVLELADREYLEHLSNAGFGPPTREAAVANQIIFHGHQALWSVSLLQTCFDALGFARAVEASVLTSDHPELRGIHGHGKTIGERNNLIETIVIEATK